MVEEKKFGKVLKIGDFVGFWCYYIFLWEMLFTIQTKEAQKHKGRLKGK